MATSTPLASRPFAGFRSQNIRSVVDQFRTRPKNLVNHVALVLDGSYSMTHHRARVIETVDGIVKGLADETKANGQETRISVFIFDHKYACLIWDTDVLRLPSIKGLYDAVGNTALFDAIGQSVTDLETVSTVHGDHAFLLYVVSDGEENQSTAWNMRSLNNKVSSLPRNWTLAALVPDENAKSTHVECGFAPGNVAVWDTMGDFAAVADRVSTATSSYMNLRSAGSVGTRTLFSTGADAVNAATVSAALVRYTGDYFLTPVIASERIEYQDFARNMGWDFRVGNGFYLLEKTETIQPQKKIVVVHRKNGTVHVGPAVRSMLGLPTDIAVRVRPDVNKEYAIYVQSTAPNRKLTPHTKALYFPKVDF